MHLKGQLHLHTTCSDGNLTPQEAADIYSSMGFDFIAYTDHDHLLKPTYRSAIEKVVTPMLVFFAIELTVSTRWGYVHVTRIEGENDELYIFNHPGEYRFSVKQTLEAIEDVSQSYVIDAVEVTHHGFYTPDYDIDTIPYPKVATDDSHTSQACGRAWVTISCDPDKDLILKKIKKNEFMSCFARSQGQPIVIA
jgi:hypothetical protein